MFSMVPYVFSCEKSNFDGDVMITAVCIIWLSLSMLYIGFITLFFLQQETLDKQIDFL